MNPAESYVELRFFCPFDIQKIPERILEAVYEQAFWHSAPPPDEHQLTLPELLLAICDEVELKSGIRKELIRYYT